MSNVYVFESWDDDELDQLLKNVQLVELNSNGHKVNNTVHDDSQVTLFEAVGTPTNKVLSNETGLALDEGSYGEEQKEGGLCQWPPLSPLRNVQ